MPEKLVLNDSPLENDEYMCVNHLKYFKNKLLLLREQLGKEIKLLLEDLTPVNGK